MPFIIGVVATVLEELAFVFIFYPEDGGSKLLEIMVMVSITAHYQNNHNLRLLPVSLITC
jgi:hypothetical protein